MSEDLKGFTGTIDKEAAGVLIDGGIARIVTDEEVNALESKVNVVEVLDAETDSITQKLLIIAEAEEPLTEEEAAALSENTLAVTAFIAKVLVTYGGAIKAFASFASGASAINWLHNKTADKVGGILGQNVSVVEASQYNVKANGNVFNASNQAYWVGPGRSNYKQRVIDLQTALKAVGKNPGTIDGLWGPNTKNAVIAWQKQKGLPADGVVGTNTWRSFCVK